MRDQADRMQVKWEALAAVAEGMPVATAAVVFAISESTLRRSARRMEADGVLGLADRSRRPHHSPEQTKPAMEELIVRARKELADDGWDNGAQSIRYWLCGQGEKPPARSTIHAVLRRHGLVQDQPQKRTKSSLRFERGATHELWQIDGMEWAFPDGSKCHIIGIIDDRSRAALRHLAAPGETGEAVWQAFVDAATTFGLPMQVLSDNGAAINKDRQGQETGFCRNLRSLGVEPISTRPGHPQCNGKRERCNGTLRRWLEKKSVATTIAELQVELDIFDPSYNRRPHQSLDGAQPLQRLTDGPFAAASPIPLRRRPEFGQRRVSANGAARFGRYRFHLGNYWHGCEVTVVLEEPRAFVFYGAELIATYDVDPHTSVQKGTAGKQPRKARRLGQR
jgi:transposase InsO family protein